MTRPEDASVVIVTAIEPDDEGDIFNLIQWESNGQVVQYRVRCLGSEVLRSPGLPLSKLVAPSSDSEQSDPAGYGDVESHRRGPPTSPAAAAAEESPSKLGWPWPPVPPPPQPELKARTGPEILAALGFNEPPPPVALPPKTAALGLNQPPPPVAPPPKPADIWASSGAGKSSSWTAWDAWNSDVREDEEDLDRWEAAAAAACKPDKPEVSWADAVAASASVDVVATPVSWAVAAAAAARASVDSAAPADDVDGTAKKQKGYTTMK